MKERSGKLTGLMALLVFTVFALCVLRVLLTGAGVYERLVSRGEDQYSSRTTVQYLATRVRQAESVAVSDFGGIPALVLEEQAGTAAYVTRVYLYDGYLRELYSAASADLSPGDGEKVLPANSLSLSLENGLLTIEAGGHTLFLQVRSGKEVSP